MSKQTIKHNLFDYIGQKFTMQYSDYEPDLWTVPVTLTELRAGSLLTDASVRFVKILTEEETIILS